MLDPNHTLRAFAQADAYIAELRAANEALKRDLAEANTRSRANWDAARELTDKLCVCTSELQEARERLAILAPYTVSGLKEAGQKIHKLREQLRPGSPTERAPTVWAYEQACKALATSRAKLEECGRDSRRIDWLQAQLDEHGTVWMLPCGDDMRFVQVRNFGECLNYPTVTGKLREALDAALAQDES